jgi:hypothetical protein
MHFPAGSFLAQLSMRDRVKKEEPLKIENGAGSTCGVTCDGFRPVESVSRRLEDRRRASRNQRRLFLRPRNAIAVQVRAEQKPQPSFAPLKPLFMKIGGVSLTARPRVSYL